MNSTLFSPLNLGPLELSNRIVVSPMCQYSAHDGTAGDWHLQHLMTLAISGAGLVTVESTAVEPRGRITHGCLGLYSDVQEAALSRAMAAARSVAPTNTRFAIQLAHAGRKASARRPWEGKGSLQSGEQPWPTVAASAIPFADGWPTPTALDTEEVEGIVEAFADAAKRAVRIGFDAIELHMAHGYLLHTFASPISNRREDAFGGTKDRRLVLPLRVAEAVAAAVPASVAVGARITGSDWLREGLGVDDAIGLARALRERGLAFVCVSSGGITPPSAHQVARRQLRDGPGYQVFLAREVRSGAGLATFAVGLILDPGQAEDIVAGGSADCVVLGRAFLDDPRWVWHAADRLGGKIELPRQFERAARKQWPGFGLARHFDRLPAEPARPPSASPLWRRTD